MNENVDTPVKDVNVPASLAVISLSQAILAPLDALFKAQVHAARSFLNLVLQIGYPNLEMDKHGTPIIYPPVPLDEKGNPVNTGPETKPKSVYTQDFFMTDQDGNRMKISIPALALVPIIPLTIDNASFKLNFKVENNGEHTQMQASEKAVTDREKESGSGWDENKRPWYLVSEPVSFRGNVAPPAYDKTESSQSSSSVINIEINLCRQPLPAGLDKLLSALPQATKITHEE